MGKSGDSFKGESASSSRTLVNPNEPTFSEQVIYLLRTMTGQDTPEKDQFVLATKSAAIGSTSDNPASPGNLSKASLIALSKALVLLSLNIEQTIAAMAAAIDADFTTTNTNIAGLGVELAGLRGDMVTRLDLALSGLNDILTVLEQSSTGDEVSGGALVSTPIVGPIHWLLWDCSDPIASTELQVKLGGTVILRAFRPGFYQFDRPLVCDEAITTSPSGSLTLSYGV